MVVTLPRVWEVMGSYPTQVTQKKLKLVALASPSSIPHVEDRVMTGWNGVE